MHKSIEWLHLKNAYGFNAYELGSCMKSFSRAELAEHRKDDKFCSFLVFAFAVLSVSPSTRLRTGGRL